MPHQQKMIENKNRKNNAAIPLNVLYAKKEKIYPADVQNINQTVKKLFF